MNRKVTGALGASLAVAALATPSAAQVPLAPRALGTGGAYVAVARGHEAVFHNPANLGLPGNPGWSLGLPQVSAGTTVLGPDLLDVRDYFDYDNLTPERRQELLARIPAEGTALEGDLRAPLLTYQRGGFGLGVAYGLTGGHTLGKDLVELFFDGYEQGRTDYSVGNTAGNRATFWDFAAGYGTKAGPLSVGATAHYYVGRSLVQTRAFEPRYDLLAQDIAVDYVGVTASGGSGYGVDVGAALETVPGFTLSAAVTNLLHSMEWRGEMRGRIVTLDRADFADTELQVIRSRYEQSEQELGDAPTGRFAEVAEGLRDEAQLPSALKLGAAWSLPGAGTTLTGEYQKHLTDGRLAGSWEQFVGAGLQQRLPVGTVRLGISSDMEDGSILGGGLSLGPVDLGLARFTSGSEGAADRNGWIASFGLSARSR